MYLVILKYAFVLLGLILFLLLTFRPVIVAKVNNNLSKSAFVSSIAGVLLFYVIIAILLAVFVNGWMYKFYMLAFASAPFIIGKLVTYEKEKIYSFIQIAVVFVSIICVYLFQV